MRQATVRSLKSREMSSLVSSASLAAFPVRIAPGEHILDGVERRDRVVRWLAWEAG